MATASRSGLKKTWDKEEVGRTLGACQINHSREKFPTKTSCGQVEDFSVRQKAIKGLFSCCLVWQNLRRTDLKNRYSMFLSFGRSGNINQYLQ